MVLACGLLISIHSCLVKIPFLLPVLPLFTTSMQQLPDFYLSLDVLHNFTVEYATV